MQPGLLAELSRPELSSRIADLDYAGAILVIGTDPLHEMPILDLRIRKAARRGGAKLLVASERPTALDGGAAERPRPLRARARPPPSSARWPPRSARRGTRPRRPHAKAAEALAEALRAVPDPVIVWGERLWRDPAAVRALHDCARALDMHQRIGPGLLEVPEEAEHQGPARGGHAPRRRPRPAPAEPRQGRRRDPRRLPRRRPAPQRRPGPHLPRRRRWAKTLAGTFVVSFAMFDDESTRHANIVFPAESHAEKEGIVTHPEGRLQRLRPNVPHPQGLRPGWRVLAEISAALGDDPGFDSAEDVFEALCSEVPFYGETAYEEIGGRGLRWQERDPGESWIPEPPARGRGRRQRADAATTAPSEGGGRLHKHRRRHPRRHGRRDGLTLGTYRDLWASEVTVRNPALRFLMPSRGSSCRRQDAKELELEHGDRSPSASNGSQRRGARRDQASGCSPGRAFLIEGTERTERRNVAVRSGATSPGDGSQGW